MVEILLNIKKGESQVFKCGPDDHFNYYTFITTKSRLKRDGKGEWTSKLNNNMVTVKRTV